MIITTLVVFILEVINSIISLLPLGSVFPTEFTDGIRTLWDILWSWDFLFPIQTMINCLAISLSFIAFVLAWRLIHWILRKIPILNIK